MITNSLDMIISWLNDNIVTFLYAVAIFLVAAVLVKILVHLFTKLLRRTIRPEMFPSKSDREKRISTLDSIAAAIISFVVWSVAVLMIMNLLGINTAPLIASAGILSVALGFGAQSLVKDFITGMFIIAENQYRVGDYVEIQNVRGTVKAVTMRTTVVVDADGSVFHIPNGSIIVTGNHTMSNNKVSIEISASTETDIELLRKIIDKTGVTQSKTPEMEDVIIEPLHFKRIKEISGSSVNVRILGKVKSGKQNDVKSDYFIALQKELVKNKIALK
jgi:small conductance mechanosensitive channel